MNDLPASSDTARGAIRAARAEDLGALLDLCRRYCEADGHQFDPDLAGPAFAGLLADDGPGFVLVAGDDHRLLGYAVVTWGWSIESGGRDALLDEIYLDRRGQGIGSRLLEAALERARAGGARRVFLETEEANAGARRFYLRHGFTPEASIWLSRDL